MEKIVTGQKNEPENHEDHGLADELESLYCHVAQLDQADSSREQREDLLPGYASAPIPPAAVPSDIRQSNKKSQELLPSNGYQQQDKLSERLNEIADAYEDISTLWPYASQHPLPAPSEETFSEILSGETQQDGIRDDRPSTAARYSLLLRYPWFIGSVATMVVLTFMFLVWPTLYHYDSLKVGTKIYPLRINRLTAHLAYFDGKAWLDSSILDDITSQQAVDSQPFPARSVITPPEIAALPVPPFVEPAEGNAAGPPSTRRSETLMNPMPFTSSADSYSNAGNVPSPPVSVKAPPNPPNAMKIARDKEKRYSIQIKAFRGEQEAQAFADDMKKMEPEIHIETVLLEGSGVWHRILLGNFKTENEALSYFTVKKAKELYPGSFIKKSQKSSESY
jgi:cell division septation protein DedD